MTRKQKLIESAIRKIVKKVRRQMKEEVDLKSPEVLSKIKKFAAQLDRELANASEPIHLIDSNRGRYAYQFFAEEYLDIQLNPDDEFYLEDYEDISNKINSFLKNGYLSEDDGIYAVPNDYDMDDWA